MTPPSTRDLIMGNPVARAFAVTGDAWTQLILREAFYGARRFSQWRDRLGMPRSVLTDRLNRLTAAGLLEQREARGSATRMEYRLTEMGLDMFGVAVMQGQWERKWARSPLQERYAMAFYDRETGARVEPAIFDHEGGRPIEMHHVRWEAGEGLTPIAPPTSRRRRTQPIETDRAIIDRSTDIMGDYWSWAVLAAAFFRLRRFDEIHEALGVATNILADRLKTMVLQGVLEKRLYQKAPPRFEYRLTEAGRDLYPMIMAMHGWSERWLCPNGSPLRLVETETSEPISAVVCDLATGRKINPRAIRWEVEAAAPVETSAA
ncbi:helix-turn-helix domain-containing protein [Brevundimonas sp.]|uniref:winged helix-turn-helix transcriptional regulator n=1 Tax=Brevundimonas sp. TaxID=1871086 RepID=UPI00286BB3DC|nr:helix-turn-helix domain-containing protein [Brevundimonas sp.]